MNEYTCIRRAGQYVSPPIIIHAQTIGDAAEKLERQYPFPGSRIDEIAITRTKTQITGAEDTPPECRYR
jgi:hypothetical protein